MATTIPQSDMSTFGPALRLLLLAEWERQCTIARTLIEQRSEHGSLTSKWGILGSDVRDYANFLGEIAGQVGVGNFQRSSTGRAFSPPIANLLVVEAKRLQDLATTLPRTALSALNTLNGYREFLIKVAEFWCE